MGGRKPTRVWWVYLLLGVLLASAYFFVPSSMPRELLYNVVVNVVGSTTIAMVIVGIRVYRPARPLPWRLFVVGLLLLVAGDVFLTVSELLGRKLVFPAPSDLLYLAFYPFMMAGLLMIGNSRLSRIGLAGVIDPLVVATGSGLLFWVYFMQPYIVDVYAGHPSITPIPVMIATAYPLMDLLLLVVLIRTLVVASNRPLSYYLLGMAFITLLTSDIVWTVAQAMSSRQISNLVDLGFLMFFSLFGAAALHPSMAALFEPVPRVEAKLTRLRLALLTGASLMAPAVLALQAARGGSINVPLFVVCSAALFLLVVARLAGMMRSQERAADRERVLRQAGAALASSQDEKDLHQATLEAALKLLGTNNPTARVSLWVGSTEGMEEVAATGEFVDIRSAAADLTAEALRRLLAESFSQLNHASSTLPLKPPGRGSRKCEVFVVPLRVRDEPTGAIAVAGRIPPSRESQNALEALGAEVALALENLQLLEEVRRTSIIKERQRLSHEIHDTLAQGFTSIVMSLSAVQLSHPKMFSDCAPTKRHLELARQTARESLAETRRLVWALRPEALDRYPLPQVLQGLTEEWSGKTGIESRLSITGDSQQLLPEIEVALLRIAQEGLANVHKHAGAKRVVLTLSYLDTLVSLDILDDGLGFDPDSPKPSIRPQDAGGFGLVSMRERVEQLGGSLSVESTPNRGTALSAALPASLAPPSRTQIVQEREAVEEAR